MKIAAAQTNPKEKSINENIEQHCLFVKEAVAEGAQLIAFPEMSITGYQRENAASLALTLNDKRLKPLKKLATQHQIIIIAGAPIKVENNLHIGSFILHPDGNEQIYTKQYLHDGEEIAFTPSFEYNSSIKLEDKQISLAICADITNPKHPAKACELKCDIYIPSIFYTPGGINEAHTDLSDYAKKFQMNILMSNFCGESYGFESGGMSAFWNKNGELLGQLNHNKEGLLIIEEVNNNSIAKEIYL